MSGRTLSLGTYTAHAVLPEAGDEIELTVFVSTDRGPAYRFRPCLTVRLTEANGSELLGTLAVALRDLRERRGAPPSTHIEGPSA